MSRWCGDRMSTSLSGGAPTNYSVLAAEITVDLHSSLNICLIDRNTKRRRKTGTESLCQLFSLCQSSRSAAPSAGAVRAIPSHFCLLGCSVQTTAKSQHFDDALNMNCIVSRHLCTTSSSQTTDEQRLQGQLSAKLSSLKLCRNGSLPSGSFRKLPG